MSHHTYVVIVWTLLIGMGILLVLASVSLIVAIRGWRGPYRRRGLVAFSVFILALPVLYAFTQVAAHYFSESLILRSRQRIDPNSIELGEQQYKDYVAHSDSGSVVHVGDEAPTFVLTDVQGIEFDAARLRGKVVLLNFFATWCGPCRLELPHIQQLWSKYEKRDDFAVIVIGRGETGEAVKAFLDEHAYSFPIAADPEGSVYSLYAKESIPRSYLISRKGQICFATTGFLPENQRRLEEELAQRLSTTE